MIMDHLHDSSGGWQSAESYGCKMTNPPGIPGKVAYYLDCGCDPYSSTRAASGEKWQDMVDKYCKRSNINIWWVENDKTRDGSDGKSKVSFKLATPQFIKSIQLPAMGWEDVLSQIGGFFGLLQI